MAVKEIISYNVNGIRAALRKGFAEWLKEASPDVICLQETKARPEQVPTEVLEHLGYHHNWVSAEKKGYSGVATFSKLKPSNVVAGCGIEKIDFEGRVIRTDFDDLTIINTYFPSGSSGDIRQAFKMEFLADYYNWIADLRKEVKNLIVVGDYNICHTEIDIHNPKQNANTSGFLPEEREWMTKYFDSGMIDTFRHFQPNPHHYSWWSYRANARNNNKGWRIDYIAASESLKERLADAKILPDVKHSDHCPIYLKLK